jgi:hypothetical protein
MPLQPDDLALCAVLPNKPAGLREQIEAAITRPVHVGP